MGLRCSGRATRGGRRLPTPAAITSPRHLPLPRARARQPAAAMIRPQSQMLWGAPAVLPPRAFTEAPKPRQPRQQLEAAFNAQLGAFMGRCSNLKLTPLEVRRDFEALLKVRSGGRRGSWPGGRLPALLLCAHSRGNHLSARDSRPETFDL